MFTQTFTDPQGQTHTDAVFQAGNAHSSCSLNESFYFNLENSEITEDSNQNLSAHFQCYYWPNQAAKDSGLPPYFLLNTDGNSNQFYIDNTELAKPEYEGLTLEQKVEYFIQNNVLGN